MQLAKDWSGGRVVLTSAALALLLGAAVLGMIFTVHAQSSGTINETWVDQMTAQWQPTQYHQMSFGAMVIPASYDQIEYPFNNLQVLSGYLNVMDGSGAGYIRIDVGFDAWLSNNKTVQSELQSLVGQAKSAGKGFILADASAEAYRPLSKRLPWSEFKQAWVQRVTTLAAFFHPEYYEVVKEPGWYLPMISDATTNPQVSDPNQWLGLTQNLTNAVHSVSPNTKVGVAIAADSLNNSPTLYVAYLEGLSKITGLNFMGFDLYTTTGFTATQSYLSQHGNGGLAVWIAECWSATDATTAYDSSRATLDANWIKAQYYFAQTENASMMIPFFTNTFASYSLAETTPTDPSQILNLLQQRTPVFSMYQGITAGLENIPKGSTATTSFTTTSGQSSSTLQTTTGSTAPPPSSGNFPTEEVAIGAIAVVLVLVIVGYLATRKRG
ncbi:MAG: hypothetical protein JRM80_13210 [Nitrososphaerota archaeon]|nr:hypothetical protein [Nitrososphaerota archaeon]